MTKNQNSEYLQGSKKNTMIGMGKQVKNLDDSKFRKLAANNFSKLLDFASKANCEELKGDNCPHLDIDPAAGVKIAKALINSLYSISDPNYSIAVKYLAKLDIGNDSLREFLGSFNFTETRIETIISSITRNDLITDGLGKVMEQSNYLNSCEVFVETLTGKKGVPFDSIDNLKFDPDFIRGIFTDLPEALFLPMLSLCKQAQEKKGSESSFDELKKYVNLNHKELKALIEAYIKNNCKNIEGKFDDTSKYIEYIEESCEPIKKYIYSYRDKKEEVIEDQISCKNEAKPMDENRVSLSEGGHLVDIKKLVSEVCVPSAEGLSEKNIESRERSNAIYSSSEREENEYFVATRKETIDLECERENIGKSIEKNTDKSEEVCEKKNSSGTEVNLTDENGNILPNVRSASVKKLVIEVCIPSAEGSSEKNTELRKKGCRFDNYLKKESFKEYQADDLNKKKKRGLKSKLSKWTCGLFYPSKKANLEEEAYRPVKSCVTNQVA